MLTSVRSHLVRRTAVLAWLAFLSAQACADDAARLIQARVGQLSNGSELRVGSASIASRVVLPAFYERRDFQPAWTDADNVAALLAAVADSASDGLEPEDYHVSALRRLRAAAPSAERDANFDLLATDALVRLAYHLRFGKIDVSRIDPAWNFRSDFEAILFLAPAAAIQQALDDHRLREALDVLRPAHPLYANLRAALARYRAIASGGAWGPLPAGGSLRPGDEDPRVPALRARLAAEGYLPAETAPDLAPRYDGILQAAVEHFQRRHGLAPDGIVGGKTLRAINVPVSARIDQLRLSLERSRLILRDLPDRLVVVNVPAYRLYYLEQGAVRFAANVVVGKVLSRTPIFRADMTYLVLNPSWTVPPVLMKNDILPGLERDPDYLERKGLQRVGNQIVQAPGPNNALGRVKLMFPNPHFVYLHDTPQQSLFERDARTFSSGCVRVQNVFDLAELIIAEPQRWSKTNLLAAVATGRTQTIVLREPVAVLLAYWTAGVDDAGETYFYDDIYDRDRPELAALDAPFRFAARAAAEATRAPRALQ